MPSSRAGPPVLADGIFLLPNGFTVTDADPERIRGTVRDATGRVPAELPYQRSVG